MDKYNNVVFDMDTSYTIYKDEEFRETCKLHNVDFYNVYYDIICNQIKKNDIVSVHSLLRWLNLDNYFVYNYTLVLHAFIHGNVDTFLMVYYIYLFWFDDDDDYPYSNNHSIYNDVSKLFEQNKNNICTSTLVLNETGLLIKDVINIIMEKQINIGIDDYEEKQYVVDKIYKKYDKLDSKWDKLYDLKFEDKYAFRAIVGDGYGDKYNYDKHHDYFVKLLLKYDIDIESIDEGFQCQYEEEISEMDSNMYY